MSQQILNANAQSFVETILTGDATKVQELTYKTQKIYPNISKSMKVINTFSSFGGDFSNNTDVFQITQSDMLSLLRVRFKCVKSTALTNAMKDAYVAENLPNNITLKMNGQPLATLSSAAIKTHYEDAHSSIQENHYRYAMPLNETTEELLANDDVTTTFICYLAIPSSFFTDVYRNIYLKDSDILSLEILYNSFSQAGFDQAFNSLTATLQVHKWLGDEPTMTQIKTKDYTGKEYRLGWSSHTEQEVLKDNNTITFACQAKYANFKLYPIIVRTNPTRINVADPQNPVAAPLYGCPRAKIRKITVQLGDEFFIYKFDRSQVNFENAYRGASSCHLIKRTGGDGVGARVPVLVYMENKCPCIEFSLGCKDDYNTGIAAFKNLNNPIITLEYDNPLEAGYTDDIGRYTCYFVHKFWQILENDPSQKVLFTKVQT